MKSKIELFPIFIFDLPIQSPKIINEKCKIRCTVMDREEKPSRGPAIELREIG
jgi:hypothetical protein